MLTILQKIFSFGGSNVLINKDLDIDGCYHISYILNGKVYTQNIYNIN